MMFLAHSETIIAPAYGGVDASETMIKRFTARSLAEVTHDKR